MLPTTRTNKLKCIAFPDIFLATNSRHPALKLARTMLASKIFDEALKALAPMKGKTLVGARTQRPGSKST